MVFIQKQIQQILDIVLNHKNISKRPKFFKTSKKYSIDTSEQGEPR
jgi:hypothetical protein